MIILAILFMALLAAVGGQHLIEFIDYHRFANYGRERFGLIAIVNIGAALFILFLLSKGGLS